MRLDIWLWRARFFKTRSLASKVISKGKVRLGRAGQVQRITKPHYKARIGDQVTFMREEELIDVTVQSLGTRRGPAPEARALYCDAGAQTP